MSFILDALRKSEEQRRRGEIPDLRAEPAPLPAPRRRPWLWPALLTGALLLNALLLARWLWPGGPDVAPPASLVQAPASGGISLPAEPPAPAPSQSAATPIATAPAAGEPAGDTHPVAVESVIRPAPAPAGWSEWRQEPPKAVAGPAVPAADRVAAARPGSGLPHLRNLPPAMRQGLPDLEITLHYYDLDPGARMVRLNGRILREGEAVAEGLRLQEITIGGVILDWRGERFRAGNF